MYTNIIRVRRVKIYVLARVFVVRVKKLCISHAPSEDSEQTAHAQSDQNLHWAHMPEGTFFHSLEDLVARNLCCVVLQFRRSG